MLRPPRCSAWRPAPAELSPPDGLKAGGAGRESVLSLAQSASALTMPWPLTYRREAATKVPLVMINANVYHGQVTASTAHGRTRVKETQNWRTSRETFPTTWPRWPPRTSLG